MEQVYNAIRPQRRSHFRQHTEFPWVERRGRGISRLWAGQLWLDDPDPCPSRTFWAAELTDYRIRVRSNPWQGNFLGIQGNLRSRWNMTRVFENTKYYLVSWSINRDPLQQLTSSASKRIHFERKPCRKHNKLRQIYKTFVNNMFYSFSSLRVCLLICLFPGHQWTVF